MAENDPPPSDSTTPAANDTGRGLLLVAALLLTAGVLWVLGRGALVWLLVLVPPAALAWVLLLGRNTALDDWLTENALVIITVPLMGWLLGALLLWFLVNAVWAAEQTDVVSENKPLAVAGATLTAAVTALAITLRDEPGALEFSFGSDVATLPDETLWAMITLPSELDFAEAPGPETRRHAIPLNGTLAERRVAIVNSGAFDGLRAAAAKPIAIELCPPARANRWHWRRATDRSVGAWCYRVRAMKTGHFSNWSGSVCTTVGEGTAAYQVYIPQYTAHVACRYWLSALVYG